MWDARAQTRSGAQGVIWSEMDLTRQRLASHFCEREMHAAVLQGVEAPDQKREDWRGIVNPVLL